MASPCYFCLSSISRFFTLWVIFHIIQIITRPSIVSYLSFPKHSRNWQWVVLCGLWECLASAGWKIYQHPKNHIFLVHKLINLSPLFQSKLSLIKVIRKTVHNAWYDLISPKILFITDQFVLIFSLKIVIDQSYQENSAQCAIWFD